MSAIVINSQYINARVVDYSRSLAMVLDPRCG